MGMSLALKLALLGLLPRLHATAGPFDPSGWPQLREGLPRLRERGSAWLQERFPQANDTATETTRPSDTLKRQPLGLGRGALPRIYHNA